MADRTLHLHDPRLGISLPARTARPFRRAGDGLLGAFVKALDRPAERVVLTGRMFDRADPPAHLVDRVVAPLAALVARGTEVIAPRAAPRGLLLLAAGIRLDDPALPEGAPAFWERGEHRLLEDDRAIPLAVDLPGAEEVRLDVGGLTGAGVLARIERRLERIGDVRFVRVVLTGRTDDPRVAALGMADLHALLPPGVDGLLVKEIEAPPAPAPISEEERKAALSTIRAALPDLPDGPGVYEFLDGKGRVLYVGKAVNVRRRVGSQFTAELRSPTPRGAMFREVRTLKVRPASGELDALLLEARRIRETRPAFNRRMRDPEAARYLRVDLDSPLPSLTIRSRLLHDGAAWYGPFPRRGLVERALRVLQVVYGLHSCGWRPGEAAPAACTDRDLSVCAAPCVGRIPLAAYRERTALAIDHLLGHETGAPPFGALNPLSAGLLTDDDLAAFHSFRRSLQRFTAGLRGANGLLPLGEGRWLLVIRGVGAEEWTVAPGEEAAAAARAAERIAAAADEPHPTAVPADRADEARILLHWFRRARGFAEAAESSKEGG